ncbi:unnamed protein product, partial [Porites evermanni]
TKACHAIDTKTVSIKGPNGAHCVQKIQRCGCVRGCYRASFRQIYTASVFDAQTNRNKTLEEVVDIGRCNGECPKRNKQQCLHWFLMMFITVIYNDDDDDDDDDDDCYI